MADRPAAIVPPLSAGGFCDIRDGAACGWSSDVSEDCRAAGCGPASGGDELVSDEGLTLATGSARRAVDFGDSAACPAIGGGMLAKLDSFATTGGLSAIATMVRDYLSGLSDVVRVDHQLVGLVRTICY